MMIHTVLLVIALICFLAATFGVTSRVNLVALGLAFITLRILLNY